MAAGGHFGAPAAKGQQRTLEFGVWGAVLHFNITGAEGARDSRPWKFEDMAIRWCVVKGLALRQTGSSGLKFPGTPARSRRLDAVLVALVPSDAVPENGNWGLSGCTRGFGDPYGGATSSCVGKRWCVHFR